MGDKPVCPSNQVTNRSSFLWLGKPGEDGLLYRKASGPIDEEQKGKEKEESGLRKRPLLSGNDSDFQKERTESEKKEITLLTFSRTGKFSFQPLKSILEGEKSTHFTPIDPRKIITANSV